MNGAHWCATQVDPAGNVVFNSWGDCSVDSCPLEAGSCDTVGGPDKGRPCVFPFTYKGETFMTCTARDHPGGLEWCSTKVSMQVLYVRYVGLTVNRIGFL